MLYDDFNEHYLNQGSLHIGGDGYAYLYLNGEYYRINRLFMFGLINYKQDDFLKIVVDHKNRNILDNTMKNLRILDKQNNEYNEKPIRKNNTSGFKGVTWDKFNHKWCAQIMYNGYNIKIGRYNTIKEALIMRLKAELYYCKPECAPQRHLFEEYQIYDYIGLPQRVLELKEKYSK